MDKQIQKKVDLNVILTVLSDIQFGHQGAGTWGNGILGGTPNLFGIFKNIFKTLFLPDDLDLV